MVLTRAKLRGTGVGFVAVLLLSAQTVQAESKAAGCRVMSDSMFHKTLLSTADKYHALGVLLENELNEELLLNPTNTNADQVFKVSSEIIKGAGAEKVDADLDDKPSSLPEITKAYLHINTKNMRTFEEEGRKKPAAPSLTRALIKARKLTKQLLAAMLKTSEGDQKGNFLIFDKIIRKDIGVAANQFLLESNKLASHYACVESRKKEAALQTVTKKFVPTCKAPFASGGVTPAAVSLAGAATSLASACVESDAGTCETPSSERRDAEVPDAQICLPDAQSSSANHSSKADAGVRESDSAGTPRSGSAAPASAH